MKNTALINVFNEAEIVNTCSDKEEANWLRSCKVEVNKKGKGWVTTLRIGDHKDSSFSGSLNMAIIALNLLFWRAQLGDEKLDFVKGELIKHFSIKAQLEELI